MKRRQLLGLLAAGLSVPLAPLQLAQAAQRSGRRLILVELSGANDGLNTIVPIRNDRYRAIRPTVALNPSEVLNLSGDMALNSRMRSLMAGWESGDMAVVQGLGIRCYSQVSACRYSIQPHRLRRLVQNGCR